MAFPTEGWPPPLPSTTRSLRVRIAGTATVNWSDNAYLFIDDADGGNPYTATPYIRPGDTTTVVNVGNNHSPGSPMGAGRQPADAFPFSSTGTRKPAVWSRSIIIRNTGANTIEFSFSAADDGSTAIHGTVPAGTTREYRDRHEAGIALRTSTGTATFELEAW